VREAEAVEHRPAWPDVGLEVLVAVDLLDQADAIRTKRRAGGARQAQRVVCVVDDVAEGEHVVFTRDAAADHLGVRTLRWRMTAR